jgi:predicted dithiol-disulfide oxidoreductase (DUF899 family)
VNRNQEDVMKNEHEVVGRDQYMQARLKLLAAERELTRQREQLAAQRRALPWLKLDKVYRFDTADGAVELGELFQGKSQLLVYHLMYAPEWQGACKSCTFWADSFDGMVPHLSARDVSFAAISRASVPQLRPYAQRLGWKFRWVSSQSSDFNYDLFVSFTPDEVDSGKAQYNFGVTRAQGVDMPGYSAFYRDPSGQVFHTYSTYSRGIELLNPVYQALDLMPKGRDEAGLSFPMAWVKRHDEY